MKFSTTVLNSSVKHYFVRAVSGIILLGMIWQGLILGVDAAFAANATSPLLATSNMAKQVDNKIEDLKDRAGSAMKDGKKVAKDNMSSAKKSIKDNAKKMESSAKDNTKKAKNFFGF